MSRSNRMKLKEFYKSKAREDAELVRNPDINLDASQFSRDAYIAKILRNLPLSSLLEQERSVGKEICELDHNMQSLVYDNYNKFIKATDTIKQMRSDFNEIEDSMNRLVSEMDSISSITTEINSKMATNREEVSELVKQSETLTKIRFLFELPAELKLKIEAKDFVGAVDDYQRANDVLVNYKNHPSFQSIQDECEQAHKLLVKNLFEPFESLNEESSTSSEELKESVRLLVKLDVETSELSKMYLKQSIRPVESILGASTTGIVEYVTEICNYLADLSVHVANFQIIFSQKNLQCSIKYQHAHEALKLYINDILLEVTEMVSLELNQADMTDDQLSMALDLWYSKLSATAQILPGLNIVGRSEDLIIDEATRRFNIIKNDLFMQIEDEILHLEKVESIQKTSSAIMTLLQQNQEKLERFFTMSKSYSQIEFFLVEWSDMTKGLKIDCIQYIADFADKYILTGNQNLLMPLSAFLRSWSNSFIEYCLDKNYSEKLETFKKRYSDLCCQALRRYVFSKGAHLAELLTRSIYARDWLGCSEPRGPRPIVKNIIDEIRNLDEKNTSYLPDGIKPTRSQKSGSHIGSYQPSVTSNNLNIQRLFCDRIEVYAETIDTTKIAITSGIIRIALRSFLEAIRLQTFSKYGLQQIQVDMGCLNHVLWRFISDERELSSLTDEILQSCLYRSVSKELMENDVISLIIEKAQL